MSGIQALGMTYYIHTCTWVTYKCLDRKCNILLLYKFHCTELCKTIIGELREDNMKPLKPYIRF